ncbi:class I SAM-dependent DNA methyltransferase [Streptomyces sp. NBC_01262]|uniref:class I SAM-dependent DNA methyltransferase n=1 Tax=Streptomyces sp. NBC_01262 TaxID=2903803 RepID=UPI002E366FF4|nr:class I SAM-dependent methyltransferase [Streptomyces sp. NBC_01262]
MGVGVYGDIQLHRAGQAEAFDAIGGRYNEAFPDKEGQLAAGGWLADSLPIGARVLDVGCGTGVPTCRQLVDAGLDVTGIDLSAGMLALARESVPEAEFHRADITAIGRLDRSLRLGRFDGVTAFFSLLMLPRAEIPHALAIVRDLLVPDGWFTLGMVEADLDDFEMPFLGNTVRVSGYLRDDLRQVVEDAGFSVVKEDSYPYSPATFDAPPEEQLFLHCRRRH